MSQMLSIVPPVELETSKVIAIFGLSADPPTGVQGHLGIVKYLISLNKFDEIWIMPVYSHIFQSKKNLLSYDHRFKMCQLNFEDCYDRHGGNNDDRKTKYCKVVVSNLEKKLYDSQYEMRSPHESKKNERLGTIDLIRHIRDSGIDDSVTLPDSNCNVNVSSVDIHLILGSDTFHDLILDKWKDSEK